jgi:hypothetical protein
MSFSIVHLWNSSRSLFFNGFGFIFLFRVYPKAQDVLTIVRSIADLHQASSISLPIFLKFDYPILFSLVFFFQLISLLLTFILHNVKGH